MQEKLAAILYDFDLTLSPANLQEYGFVEAVGHTPDDFWAASGRQAGKHRMDSVLSYMLLMLTEAKRHGIRMTREYLAQISHDVVFFPGVERWFQRMNAYAAGRGITLEHYIISANLREMIKGTPIAKEFKEIFACSYHYNDEGVADWPALAVNYTAKTQFVYRVNKGFLDISDNTGINRPMPKEQRRVPFERMIYIGDGMTDVPAMQVVKQSGGRAVAVYTDMEIASQLLKSDRVNQACPADYREGSPLDLYIKRRIDEIA